MLSCGPEDKAGSAGLLRSLFVGLRQHGLTRLADQTGLDRLSVPCFAAIRPNALTVTTHQGKGETDDDARFSALMEAAEYAYAEALPRTGEPATLADLRRGQRAFISPAPLLPAGAPLDAGRELHWREGRSLTDGSPVAVPRDMVALTDPLDLPDLAQSTNGLAAGFTAEAAHVHGLCELIERDAMVLWGLLGDEAAAARRLDPEAFGDPALSALCRDAEASDVAVALFDITSDIGVPVIYAVLTDGRSDRRMAVTTGAACHPSPARAALKALLEAAQTRVSLISGARDDIEEKEYERAVPHILPVAAATFARPPTGFGATATTAQLGFVLEKLMAAGLRQIVATQVGGDDLGIHVEKLFVPGLEDRLTNRHWRPGPRAVRKMLARK